MCVIPEVRTLVLIENSAYQAGVHSNSDLAAAIAAKRDALPNKASYLVNGDDDAR